MQLASVPEPLNFTTTMVGPVIADLGSQQTKRRGRRRLPLRPGSAPGAGTLDAAMVPPAPPARFMRRSYDVPTALQWTTLCCSESV